jgi:hypothetical protein
LPTDLLPAEAVDWHLDRRDLVEYDSDERRSLGGQQARSHRIIRPWCACVVANGSEFVRVRPAPCVVFGPTFYEHCQLAVFSGKLPFMEAEIDCKMQSNSR